jgi:hypothetical protein
MDFNKFYRNGWGLHRATTEYIYNIIKHNNIKNVLEFGSGGSTEFLIEARSILCKDYSIDSFDHNTEFCFKGHKPEFLKLMIRDLVVSNRDDYEKMFTSKKFCKECFSKTNDLYNTSLQNSTYDINDGDLKDNYNLVIIDGPNGNGRNFSYFYLMGKLESGSFIVIDDYFHYDFLEKCKLFFDYEILDESKFPNDHPNKGHAILKIK